MTRPITFPKTGDSEWTNRETGVVLARHREFGTYRVWAGGLPDARTVGTHIEYAHRADALAAAKAYVADVARPAIAAAYVGAVAEDAARSIERSLVFRAVELVSERVAAPVIHHMPEYRSDTSCGLKFPTFEAASVRAQDVTCPDCIAATAPCTVKVNSAYPHRFEHDAAVAADATLTPGYDTCGMTEAKHAGYTPARIYECEFTEAAYRRAVELTHGRLDMVDCWDRARRELLADAEGEAYETCPVPLNVDGPIFPEGTPEYEAYAAKLRAELRKFAAGEDPYPYGPMAGQPDYSRCDVSATSGPEVPHGGEVRPYRSTGPGESRWMVCESHAISTPLRRRFLAAVDVTADESDAYATCPAPLTPTAPCTSNVRGNHEYEPAGLTEPVEGGPVCGLPRSDRWHDGSSTYPVPVVDGPRCPDPECGERLDDIAAGRVGHCGRTCGRSCTSTDGLRPHLFEDDEPELDSDGYDEWERCGKPADHPDHIEGAHAAALRQNDMHDSLNQSRSLGFIDRAKEYRRTHGCGLREARQGVIDEDHAEATRMDAARTIAAARAPEGERCGCHLPARLIASHGLPPVPADVSDDVAWAMYCATLPDPTDEELAAVLAEYTDPDSPEARLAECLRHRRDAVRSFRDVRDDLRRMRHDCGVPAGIAVQMLDALASIRGSIGHMKATAGFWADLIARERRTGVHV